MDTRCTEPSFAAIDRAPVVTVSSKYQVVIPKEIRRRERIKPGDQCYVYHLNGGITFTRIPSIEEVQQMFAEHDDADETQAAVLPADVRVKIERSLDELLSEYKYFNMFGTPPSFRLSENYQKYHDLILERFENARPGGRAWYEGYAGK